MSATYVLADADIAAMIGAMQDKNFIAVHSDDTITWPPL
jgi:hypothetical protein